jgi:hypothetical protein
VIAETAACRSAALIGRLAFLDQGPAPARLRVYGGAQPASAEQLPDSPMLCEITLSKPAGEVTLDGGGASLTLTPAGEGLILVTGVATWVRVVNGDGVNAFDMSASAEGAGGKAQFTTSQLYAGGALRLLGAVVG